MNLLKCNDFTPFTSPSPPKRPSPAPRQQDANQKLQYPAHDAFTRLLQRQPLDTKALWQEAERFVDKKKGLLVLDDTTLDKPYAQKMELVTYHWSGKHQRMVKGIALLTLLWTDRFIACGQGSVGMRRRQRSFGMPSEPIWLSPPMNSSQLRKS